MASLKELKERVWKCNMALFEQDLVIQTFGNVNGLDHKIGILAIKPSGVAYKDLKSEHIEKTLFKKTWR